MRRTVLYVKEKEANHLPANFSIFFSSRELLLILEISHFERLSKDLAL